MGQALAGIHQNEGSRRVGKRNHFCQGVAAAQGITDMHKAHKPGALAELGSEILQIQLTGLGDAHMTQHTTGPLG